MKNKNSVAAFRKVLSLFDQELTPVIRAKNGELITPTSFLVEGDKLIIGESERISLIIKDPPETNKEQEGKTELAIEMCKRLGQPFTIIKKRLGGKK